MIRNLSKGAAFGSMIVAWALFVFAAHGNHEDSRTWIGFAIAWSLIAIAHKD